MEKTSTTNIPNPLRLRHYFTHHQSLGGVQSIIDTHLALDPEFGSPSSLLAFFDPETSSDTSGRLEGLGLKGKHTIRKARHRFQRHESAKDHDISIFHDLWGLAFFGEFDSHAFRRIGAVHSQWPHLDHQLKNLSGSLDGIFCDSQEIADFVLRHLPEMSPDRVRHLPVPAQIAPDEFCLSRSPLSQRPIQLGFVGRIDYAQKRVERFPPLTKHLRSRGIECELHFLGTGQALAELPSKFSNTDRVHFHGRQSGDDYWRHLAQWDFVVYTSDHEGSPLAMSEAMSTGCIPIFPQIGCGADDIVREIDPTLLYPPEDWDHIAKTLAAFGQKTPDEIQQIRARSRKLSERHSPENYHAKFRDLLQHVTEQPRISREFLSPRPWFAADFLPFAALRRWHPKGFFNANRIKSISATRAEETNHR